LMASNDISADTVAHSLGNKFESLSFSIHEDDFQKAVGILDEYKKEYYECEIQTKENLAKLSVIGAGIAYDTDIAGMFYEALLNENIKIYLLSLSALKISALVDKNEADRALSALHTRYAEEGKFGSQAPAVH